MWNSAGTIYESTYQKEYKDTDLLLEREIIDSVASKFTPDRW